MLRYLNPSCLLIFCWCLTTVQPNPLNKSLPDALRQFPESIVQMLNISSDFQVDSISNTSGSLSNISFSDIENDNLTHALQLRYRERKKQERISLIRNQILTRLHMNQQPNMSTSIFSQDEQQRIAQFMEKLQSTEPADSGAVIQWLQSFYPSCSPPNNTDKLSWEQPETLRIVYELPFNRYTSSDVTIINGKLRLYKVLGNDPNFVAWDPSRPRYNMLDALVNNRAANGLNVNIYQYMKPLRANKREKKRLVDSRTISVDYKGWVEFNIISALNFWFSHNNKNFGLDVEVEDAFGNKLNPNVYFQNMNCSSETTRDSPFPNILDIHQDLGKNETTLFDNETYPTLDMRTAEIPRGFEPEPLADSVGEQRVLKKRAADQETEENTCEDEIQFNYVDFAEIGLDEYILWPRGVLWALCEGTCASKENSPSNREYFFSSWFQQLFKHKIKPRTDCVVTRRESLPVILYDGENQVFEDVLKDFVPTNCGCRAS